MSSSARSAADVATPFDLEAITNDIASLKQDLAALMRHMKLGATDGLRTAARSAADQIGDGSSRAYDALAAQGERAVKAVGRQVEEQPVTSLLIAFAVGFLGSRMLSR